MNLSSNPWQRVLKQYRSLSLPRQCRHVHSAVAATAANVHKLTAAQLQYGKPNKPSPPSTHKRLDQIHANIPAYPHPRRYWYKKANLGLYGNLAIRSGNNVSEQNEHKTPRVWRPNVQHKRLWSECLGRFVRLKIATRIIRTVDKCGGLDNYLLSNRKGRIRELGMAGWALRWRVLRTIKGRERAMKERKELGLSGTPAWMDLPFAVKWLAAQEKKLATGVPVPGLLAGGSTEVDVVSGSGMPGDVVLDEAAAADLERQIDEELDQDDEAEAITQNLANQPSTLEVGWEVLEEDKPRVIKKKQS